MRTTLAAAVAAVVTSFALGQGTPPDTRVRAEARAQRIETSQLRVVERRAEAMAAREGS
jgi:hypothetical protein